MKSILYGSKVNLCHLDSSNLDEYLTIYKRSSVFASAYETMPDLWRTQERAVKSHMDEERYLIVEKVSEIPCGIVEFHYIFEITPEINIMITPEYRRNGYGYEASKILCNKILSDDIVEYIMWNTFASNNASCRIAEKLGGVKVDSDNFNFAVAELAQYIDDCQDIMDTVTYEIRNSNVEV